MILIRSESEMNPMQGLQFLDHVFMCSLGRLSINSIISRLCDFVRHLIADWRARSRVLWAFRRAVDTNAFIGAEVLCGIWMTWRCFGIELVLIDLRMAALRAGN